MADKPVVGLKGYLSLKLEAEILNLRLENAARAEIFSALAKKKDKSVRIRTLEQAYTREWYKSTKDHETIRDLQDQLIDLLDLY